MTYETKMPKKGRRRAGGSAGVGAGVGAGGSAGVGADGGAGVGAGCGAGGIAGCGAGSGAGCGAGCGDSSGSSAASLNIELIRCLIDSVKELIKTEPIIDCIVKTALEKCLKILICLIEGTSFQRMEGFDIDKFIGQILWSFERGSRNLANYIYIFYIHLILDTLKANNDQLKRIIEERVKKNAEMHAQNVARIRAVFPHLVVL